MKHLQYTYETSKTLEMTCNMRFHFSFVQRSIERGTAGSGQLAAEDGGAALQQLVLPMPGLGLASDDPLS
jgi:hypothetical protein